MDQVTTSNIISYYTGQMIMGSLWMLLIYAIISKLSTIVHKKYIKLGVRVAISGFIFFLLFGGVDDFGYFPIATIITSVVIYLGIKKFNKDEWYRKSTKN